MKQILLFLIALLLLAACHAAPAEVVAEPEVDYSAQLQQPCPDPEPPALSPEYEQSDEPNQIAEAQPASNIESKESIPDWDAILKRVSELADFFETNLAGGISLEDAKGELGVEPVRIWNEWLYDGHERPIKHTFYSFDLMTSPNYTSFHTLCVFTGNANHEQLLSGDIGIVVSFSIRGGNGNLAGTISIAHGEPSMDRSFHNMSIFMFGSDVIANSAHIIPHPFTLN